MEASCQLYVGWNQYVDLNADRTSTDLVGLFVHLFFSPSLLDVFLYIVWSFPELQVSLTAVQLPEPRIIGMRSIAI
jgi:hypothetical protein